jgi:membrane associated rhomboid family serine protease
MQIGSGRVRFRPPVFILPIGLEDSRVNRIPWVSIGIVAVTLLFFLVTWVLRPDFEVREGGPLHQAITYWEQHPHAQPSDATLTRLGIKEEAMEAIEESRAAFPRPDDDELAEQSARLEELLLPIAVQVDRDLLRRLAVVPARGFLQIGWLTHIFLHFGWGHLLGNLLFFYVVAAFLEDVWGRPLYLAFYLLGGLVAALCQASLDMGSTTMLVGASGAIAACMGGFAFRFPTRKVGFFYFYLLFFRPRTGFFKLPAWIWCAFWFASQLVNFLVFRNDSNVAFMAHLAGFGFGFGIAAMIKFSKLEEKVLAPQLEKANAVWKVDPRVERARAAMDGGNRDEAQALFAAVLAEKPDEVEAALALARLELEAGNVAAATQRATRLLARYSTAGEIDQLKYVMLEVGGQIDFTQLSPALAIRLAELYEADDWRLSLRLYDAAAGGQSMIAAKANLRAGEMLCDRREQFERALAYGKAALPLCSGQPTMVERAQKVVERATQVAGPQAGLNEPPPRPEPEVIEGKLAGARADKAIVELPDGAKRELPYAKVLAIAAAQVGDDLLVDLITEWEPQHLFRLRAGAAHAEAFHRFCTQVIAASGAACIPSREVVLAKPLARYPDLAAFQTACYARVA